MVDDVKIGVGFVGDLVPFFLHLFGDEPVQDLLGAFGTRIFDLGVKDRNFGEFVEIVMFIGSALIGVAGASGHDQKADDGGDEGCKYASTGHELS